GVLRIQHDILQKSALGFIVVNRSQEKGDIGQDESTYGVDLNILHGNHIAWTSQAVVNHNDAHPGLTTGHVGWNSQFTFDSELWSSGLQVGYLGDKFDVSNTGFLPETGRYSNTTFVQYKPFINRFYIRQLFLELNHDHLIRVTGEMDDSGEDAN